MVLFIGAGLPLRIFINKPIWDSESKGLFKVINSYNTTPKDQTSHFSS